MALARSLVACTFPLAFTLGAAVARANLPPDVVKLADGSFFRGVILEKVAGDHLDLQLPSGERRRFALRDVVYSGAPPPEGASYGLAVAGPVAHVDLRGDEPGLTYEVRTGEVVSMRGGGAVYASICTAPCQANLPVGLHRLAISRGTGQPAEVLAPVEVSGPARLDASYLSREKERILGAVTLAAGTLAGMGFVLGSFNYSPNDFKVDGWLLGTGIGLFAAGLGAGLYGVLLRDQASIRVVPIPVAGMRREGQRVDGGGLGLEVAF